MLRLSLALAVLIGLLSSQAHSQQRVGSTGFLAPALTTTPVIVKAGTGILDGISCSNPNASTAFVQLFDTTGAVTLGTTVPNASIPIGAGASAPVLSQIGVNFIHGLKIAATTGIKNGVAPAVALDCSLAIR